MRESAGARKLLRLVVGPSKERRCFLDAALCETLTSHPFEMLKPFLVSMNEVERRIREIVFVARVFPPKIFFVPCDDGGEKPDTQSEGVVIATGRSGLRADEVTFA
jgi:hypothetical protein